MPMIRAYRVAGQPMVVKRGSLAASMLIALGVIGLLTLMLSEPHPSTSNPSLIVSEEILQTRVFGPGGMHPSTILIATNTLSLRLWYHLSIAWTEWTHAVQRSLHEKESSSLQWNHNDKYDTTQHTDLPAYTNVFANVWDPFDREENDLPFFWYIPKAGGLTVQHIFTKCLNLVTASAKVQDEKATEDFLQVITGSDGGRYVNVNPGNKLGIERAGSLGLVSSGLADVYVSHFLVHSAEKVFKPKKAFGFCMMRHPVKRIVDLFYYQQRAAWDADRYDVDMAQMSLAQFAVSDKVVENFMVRSLANVPEEDVTKHDLEVAKNVLRRKFVVGIVEWFDLSLVRFEKRFGWWDGKRVWGDRTINYCHYEEILYGNHIGEHVKTPNGNTAADDPWIVLSVRNWADIELYVYAKQLFVDQGKLIDN